VVNNPKGRDSATGRGGQARVSVLTPWYYPTVVYCDKQLFITQG
jgi:hypothetical protein